jgi:PAS domain S-box-containing protein
VTTEQQHERLLELVNDSVMTRTMEGIINFWNHSAEQLYGWRKEEAIGKVSHSLLQTQFPLPLEKIESELIQNGRWEGKLVHTTREGSRVVVESRWTLDLNEKPGSVVEINAPLTDGDVDPKAGADNVEIGRQEPLPASKLMKADDLLPRIASIFLAAGALLCIFVSFYFIYYYAWTAQRDFSSPFGMILHVVFPAVLASLLLAFLQRSPEFKVNAAILCLSLTVSAYAGELFLRLLGPPVLRPGKPLLAAMEVGSKEERQKAANLAKQFGVNVDIRDRLEVITDLQKRGTDAVTRLIIRYLIEPRENKTSKSTLNIGGTETIPLGGIANKVTVLCNESGEWVTYHSDEHGFHNPNGIWASGHIDVAAVGDSFTHGYCVPSEKNFVDLIRKRYPATLNLGIAGEGPLLELATLKEYLGLFKPKVVLWFYYEGNDLTDLRVEERVPLLMRYLKDDFSQNLLGRQSDIDQALAEYFDRQMTIAKSKRAKEKGSDDYKLMEVAKLSRLRQKFGLVYGTQIKSQQALSYVEGPVVDRFREILSQAASRVSAWDGRLYFVYLPAWSRYADASELGVEQRTTVLNIVRSLGIPIIDIHPSFQAKKDPLSLFPFRESGHYNEEGHRVVADEVLKTLSREPAVQSTDDRWRVE